MPRKPAKPREKKIAEDFFRVDASDVQYAIEKKYSPLEVELPSKKEKFEDEDVRSEIKPEVKKVSKFKSKGKFKSKPKKNNQSGSSVKTPVSKKSSRKPVEFQTPKLKLKSEGYELIVTEKPQAALKIASALGKSSKQSDKGVPYYEVNRKGKKIVVACAVGHLFTLNQVQRGQSPAFDLTWVPNYLVRKKDFSKKYYDTLVRLVKNAASLTIATDYDVEGEVIGLNILRYAAGQEDASRMKFSTLTEKELNEAYESKSNKINWGQAIAGETRHYLDWMYGINISRLLMSAIKRAGSFRIYSIGRVQGPALNLIVEKEREISAFKPETYWQVFINLEKPEMELVHNRDIFKKDELKKFENLKGKKGIASTKKTQETLQPNPPFNLTTLQTEAYRIFGISPSRTLSTAQSLYLAGLISYPRTSSQKLPPSIGYQEILKNLAKNYNVQSLITRKTPIEGAKSDPAHPSIYPTGNFSELDNEEKKIYELIVKRFLCLFMDDAIMENKTVTVKVNDLDFIRKGSAIKKSSWLEIYPSKFKEKELPDVEGEVKIKDFRIEEKETQPPRRYSPASLLSELEKRNLGTKATRANILETLYDRGYVQDSRSIKATHLGMSLIETLEKHSPVIIDEALTREFEKDMDVILEASQGFKEKEQKTIDKAKKAIIEISNQFKREEEAIGKELLGANEKFWGQQREESRLNKCPLCKEGNLKIMYSKKTTRYFIACDKYPECKNTYSLPPNGLIKKTEKECESCGFPILMRITKGKRPWEFCFNKDCEKNKERLEAYKKKQEEENSSQNQENTEQ